MQQTRRSSRPQSGTPLFLEGWRGTFTWLRTNIGDRWLEVDVVADDILLVIVMEAEEEEEVGWGSALKGNSVRHH